MTKKIIIASNTAWSLVNFRSGLIRGLLLNGYNVVAVAPNDGYAYKLPMLGCRYLPLKMDNKGTHPGRDLALFYQFYKLIKSENPDFFLGYTIKPNIYGSLAASILGVPAINNIAGLGVVFTRSGWLNKLVVQLYRIALLRSKKVFFQNAEDLQLFVSGGLVNAKVADRLPGSGVDLVRFSLRPLPENSTIRFLLIARMLWDKGVGEFVSAARILKNKGITAEFCLLGFLDVKNPTAINRRQMNAWVDEGIVIYLGVSDDVRTEISQAHCVVLPSFYREGTPRTLLEAAAMGRPIITTDSVGCRDVVDDGVNGYLVKPRDVNDLADKMECVTAVPSEDLAQMGKNGRAKVEAIFDEKFVINKYLKTIADMAKNLS